MSGTDVWEVVMRIACPVGGKPNARPPRGEAPRRTLLIKRSGATAPPLAVSAAAPAAAGVRAEVADHEGEDDDEPFEAHHLVGPGAPHQRVGQRGPRQDEEAEERHDPGVERPAQQVAEDEDEEQRQPRRDQREERSEASHCAEITTYVGFTVARMPDYSDLKAIYINCTLKRSPEPSHTQGLADRSIGIMQENGVEVDQVRALDHAIATGVWPDMTEHGWERDEWPAIFDRVMAADILVITSPIWLGQKSSICMQVIERLYGNSHLLNDQGQYAYYGRVGGCLITGKEDGIKHCAMEILYSLGHLGFPVPPQADAGWIGEAGPGPSYLDEGSGGPGNDFTNRNTAFMTWNLLHVARMLKDAGGIPAHGNQRSEWDAGARFDYPNPEHR